MDLRFGGREGRASWKGKAEHRVLEKFYYFFFFFFKRRQSIVKGKDRVSGFRKVLLHFFFLIVLT